MSLLSRLIGDPISGWRRQWSGSLRLLCLGNCAIFANLADLAILAMLGRRGVRRTRLSGAALGCDRRLRARPGAMPIAVCAVCAIRAIRAIRAVQRCGDSIALCAGWRGYVVKQRRINALLGAERSRHGCGTLRRGSEYGAACCVGRTAGRTAGRIGLSGVDRAEARACGCCMVRLTLLPRLWRGWRLVCHRSASSLINRTIAPFYRLPAYMEMFPQAIFASLYAIVRHRLRRDRTTGNPPTGDQQAARHGVCVNLERLVIVEQDEGPT